MTKEQEQPRISECCLKGFAWDGTPQGEETKLGAIRAYVTGVKKSETNNDGAAIILVHDLFGWTFPNTRLLADYYADQVGVQVWVPDFFEGQVLDSKVFLSGDWSTIDFPGFLSRNSKEQRREGIFTFTRELGKQYRRIGAIGFCYGGWAVMQLGAREHNRDGERGLVDCIAMAHPSWCTEEEIDALGVPVQIQAPETDPQFTPELKEYANRVIPTLGIPYEYSYFPGVEHGFATRGDSLDAKNKQAMRRSMAAAVAWFNWWLKSED